MSRKLTHQRFVAWLAIAAMWLMIVAPVVSRSLPDAPSMPGMDMGTDMGASCPGHGADAHHPSAPSEPSLHMDHCGYCTLLGHSPLLSGHTIVFSPPALPVARVLPRWTFGTNYVEPVLSANPRGPPSLRQG